MSYLEDIWKLKFSKEKCKVLYTGSKNIEVEYKYISSNKEIKKVNENCDLVVGFDDTFKVDDHILLLHRGEKEMTDGMVRNFISREANFVLKYIKP